MGQIGHSVLRISTVDAECAASSTGPGVPRRNRSRGELDMLRHRDASRSLDVGAMACLSDEMARHYRYTDGREVAVHPLVVWEVLTDHHRMSEWMPARKIVLETIGSPERDGVGAIRAIHSFGTVIRERITTFDAPTTLRYELLSGLPFRDYTGQITVEPRGDGSRISTEISFSTTIPGSQLLVAIAIRVANARAARAACRRSS